MPKRKRTDAEYFQDRLFNVLEIPKGIRKKLQKGEIFTVSGLGLKKRQGYLEEILKPIMRLILLEVVRK